MSSIICLRTKTKAVQQFLAEHPKVRFHFTPTYSSWLNQVELWFAKIQRDLLARGIFTSVADLSRKIRQIHSRLRQSRTAHSAGPIQIPAEESLLILSLGQLTSLAIQLGRSRILYPRQFCKIRSNIAAAVATMIEGKVMRILMKTPAGRSSLSPNIMKITPTAMRRLVDRVLECKCPELADCGRIASAIIESAR